MTFLSKNNLKRSGKRSVTFILLLAAAHGHTDSSLISLAADPEVCQRVRGYEYNHQTIDLLLGSQDHSVNVYVVTLLTTLCI